MPTYNDNHSESDQSIAYPVFPRPQLRINSRITALPGQEEEQRPVSSSLLERDLFHDSLFVSGAKSRPRNPWAVVGSITLLSLILLALVVIPLFHAEPLPNRRLLTMLYLPPAAAASNVTTLPVSTSTSRNTPTIVRIPIAVRTMQQAPAPPVEAAGGLLGGVPGGVVGGIPDGVLRETLIKPSLSTASIDRVVPA